MSNATLKKRRQNKSIKTSNSKKLKYSVNPFKINKDIKWQVIEGKSKVVSIFKKGKESLRNAKRTQKS